MIETTTLISDVQGEFEGGNSLSVNWDSLIRRAVENMLDNCRPETLKRRVPIYGGLASEVGLYYAPANILVPSDLYTNDNERKFKYMPSKTFHTKQFNNSYTIEYINGARFLSVNHNVKQGSLTIDTMEAVGTKTGGSPALNAHNKLTGSYSVEATFTDAGVEFGDTITAIDITDYLRGVIIVPAYLSDAIQLSSLEFRLKTDDSNYYSIISTSDSIGDFFVDGWNTVKFEMASKTTQGAPTNTNIVERSIIGTTTSGNTLTIPFDKIMLQKFAPYYLEFYSSAPYISGSTGAYWQTTVNSNNNDKINADRDVQGILHYEMCILVDQASTFRAIDRVAGNTFKEELARKHQAYWSTHPSSEAPHSYSKSPEIDISQDIDYGRTQDDTESIET